jgi:hypothetical protein
MHKKVASPNEAGYKTSPALSVVVGSAEPATAEASVEVLVEDPSSVEDGALVSTVPVVSRLLVADALLLVDTVSDADSTSPEVVYPAGFVRTNTTISTPLPLSPFHQVKLTRNSLRPPTHNRRDRHIRIPRHTFRTQNLLLVPINTPINTPPQHLNIPRMPTALTRRTTFRRECRLRGRCVTVHAVEVAIRDCGAVY